MTDRMPQELTVATLLTRQAHERGAKVAYRFVPDGEVESGCLTFAELELDARAVAARLQDMVSPGDRALILAPDEADFIRAFMGCQHAGVIAVPAYPPVPLLPGRLASLRTIVRDCQPSVVITGGAAATRDVLCGNLPQLRRAGWIAVDRVGQVDATWFRPVRVAGTDVSFLQYTSGSTGSPKGVVVTHDALLHNQALISRSFRATHAEVTVSWLPLFHDMGLIGNVIQTLYLGAQLVLLPPLAFIQRPARWLRAISRFRATASGGPNFGFELCVRRVPPEERPALDLRSWRLAFTGAEPVRAATLEAFEEAFAVSGFDGRAWYSCYGLAESTLLATGSERGAGSTRLKVDPRTLGSGRVVPGDHVLVGSGKVRPPRRVEIVDERTGRLVAPGTVGEIWLAGPDIARGYWRNAAESERVFAARLAGTGDGPFLRTGDLGFVHDGELFVTGRLKDVIIVDGRNHYPQDIEATAEEAHPAVQFGGCVAFSLDQDDCEQLVVVAEVKRYGQCFDIDEVDRAIRTAVSSSHGVQVGSLRLVMPRSIPRTSSGKLQRRACRTAFERGELKSIRLTDARGLAEVC